MSALGERFRSAREARGLSLSDVSEQIRIRSVYLAAIEEQNWAAIGAPVYVRGFLRTYARFLGLDSEDIVAEFNRGSQDALQAPAAPGAPAAVSTGTVPQKGHAGGGGSAMIWTAALVAVALIAFVVYNELSLRRQGGAASVAAVSTATPSALPSNNATPNNAAPNSAPPVASGSPGPGSSPGPSASPGASPGLASDGKQTLALVLSAPSWLRVTVDGNVSMEGTFPAGTSKTFHGRSALVLIGNAGGVEVYVDGKDLGKLGKSGDVVEHAFTL